MKMFSFERVSCFNFQLAGARLAYYVVRQPNQPAESEGGLGLKIYQASAILFLTALNKEQST